MEQNSPNVQDDGTRNAEGKSITGGLLFRKYPLNRCQETKRQGLGLVKSIGELFKPQILMGRIMHECIKKLLSDVDNPEEEETESLCKLLTTVGHALDISKACGRIDVYFSRMKELAKSNNVTSRI